MAVNQIVQDDESIRAKCRTLKELYCLRMVDGDEHAFLIKLWQIPDFILCRYLIICS